MIINGDIICNANPQNYRVFGGGKNTSNSTTNGKVTGDVLIELGPHCRVPWVYGGGYNSSVGGNVTIILNGDINDPDHQVGNITGGGLGSSTSPTGGSAVIASTGKDSGTVTGNVNVYLYSGRFSAISAGGGQNSTGTRSSAIKNTTSAYYGKSLYYASVGGDVNVVIGTEGAADQTAVHTIQNDSTVGSDNSIIQGNVNITINDGAYFPQGLTGMGRNDVVEGSVNIIMNGGYIEESLHGLGEMWYEKSPYPTQTIGKSTDLKEGSYYPKTVLSITVRGGEAGAVAWSGVPLIESNPGGYGYNQQTLYGNVLINIEDGSVGQVYMGNPTKADPNGFQNLQKLPKVYGTKGIELHITGGTFTGNPSIYAHEITTGYNGQRVYFENDVPVYLYPISSANSIKNGDQADIIVQNTQPVSIRYYVNSRGTQYPALKDCGDIEIIGGTLALAGENTIAGDLTIHTGGTLALPAADEEVPQNAVLNAEGSVSLSGDSAGWLYTVEPVKYDWSSGSYRITAGDDGLIPEEGQVYVRSNTTNEQAASEGKSEVDSTLLDLANTPGNGRYVEYTTEAASTAGYRHAWRIAVAMEVLIEPGDVTIYMGGSGYEGTVVSGGSSAEDSGFPEPGFLVTLPETLQKELEADGKDITALKLQYKADGQNVSAEWGFEKYGPGDHNVYRIKPIGQTSATKVMMTFTTSDGTTVDSDEFDFDKYLYQELKMKVYGSGIEEGKVTVAYEGREYAIATDTGTLTVRGASAAPDAEQYGEIVVLNEAQTRDATGDALAQIGQGNSGAIVLPETFYTINGTHVQVQEGDEIALLFDSILETPENPNANTDLLIAKAEEILGDTVDEKVQYEARYLDLVDRTNGNAWVAASTPITVCWPLPEGTTGNTSFELLHFLGLHREMGTSTIASKIDTCTVERVPVTVTDTHVMFTIEPYQNENGNISGGFSPFVLAASTAPSDGLTVTNAVAGSAGEQDREWNFTVTLSDTAVNGMYGGMTFVNGVATFALRGGESVTATGLPAGTFYAVSEAEADSDGYRTTSPPARQSRAIRIHFGGPAGPPNLPKWVI